TPARSRGPARCRTRSTCCSTRSGTADPHPRMPTADPLVSFVIAAYNGAAFLDDALRSVTSQTHPHLEIIVVDYGSIAESPAIVEAWTRRDSRVRLVRGGHRGPQHARNAGVGEARGAF